MSTRPHPSQIALFRRARFTVLTHRMRADLARLPQTLEAMIGAYILQAGNGWNREAEIRILQQAAAMVARMGYRPDAA